jgi:hypothetical protein
VRGQNGAEGNKTAAAKSASLEDRSEAKKEPIHPSVRECLGYSVSDTDEEIYADWKGRTSRVCKPCWEL